MGNSCSRWCQRQHYNLQLCYHIHCKYVYCVRIFLHLYQRSEVARHERSLPWRGAPSLRSTAWRNNGSHTRNCSCFEHHIRICSGGYQHSRGEIEMPGYNRDWDLSVGASSSQCTRTSHSHAPSCIVTTHPSRTGLNPLHQIFLKS